MDVLFVAGVVGAVLFVCMLVATLSSAGRARPGAMLALATILMIGATEGAWSVGILDLLSFSLIALLLTGPTARPLVSGVPQLTVVPARRRTSTFV